MSVQNCGFIGEVNTNSLATLTADPTTWNTAPVSAIYACLLKKYTPVDVSAQGVTRPALPAAGSWLTGDRVLMLYGEALALKAVGAASC